jgi:hypothetical protein
MLKKALIALLLLVTTAAAASTPHQDWVRASLGRLPQTQDDRVSESRGAELDQLASSIAAASVNAPRSPREWSALMLAVGSHETNFAGRLLRGQCRVERHECDSIRRKDGTWFARARGWGQVHRNSQNAAIWDAAETDIEQQTKLVDQRLRSAYWTCARSGEPWVTATLNAYFGARCSSKWPGLDKRVATFQAVVGR